MKIAYIVLRGWQGGGIEKYTEEVGSRLASRGHEVTVYVMKHYGVQDGPYRGMTIRTVPTLRIRAIEKLAASLAATLMEVITGKAEVVHFHAFGPAMWNFIPKWFGRRVVVQGHGLEWKRSRWSAFGKGFLKLSEAPSVRFANAVTVVSKVQQQYLLERYGKNSTYIPTGVNPPTIPEPEYLNKLGVNPREYILFAARLVPEKGLHYLIEAFKQIASPLKLVIAGDAAHEESYKKYLHQLSGGRNDILFTGFIGGRELAELFAYPYLFVLPSEIEGLPIALLEAMSYGNCCLASDIAENQEALQGQGYTFRNKNVQDLETVLRTLIANPKAVAAIRPAAQDHVLKNYHWDSIAEEYEKLYFHVLGQSRSSSNPHQASSGDSS